MFVCGLCKQLSAPGETAKRVVTQFRPMRYTDEAGNVSAGREVVTEVLAHEVCALALPQEIDFPNRHSRRMVQGAARKKVSEMRGRTPLDRSEVVRTPAWRRLRLDSERFNDRQTHSKPPVNG